VTTPQQVAVDDASRAVAMFEKLEVPVLGIVENMSYLLMPDGSELAVFGEGGGEHLAFALAQPSWAGFRLILRLEKVGILGTLLCFWTRIIRVPKLCAR